MRNRDPRFFWNDRQSRFARRRTRRTIRRKRIARLERDERADLLNDAYYLLADAFNKISRVVEEDYERNLEPALEAISKASDLAWNYNRKPRRR
jgi:hypothetical protein